MRFLCRYIRALLFGAGSRVVDIGSDCQQPSPAVGIMERLAETLLVAPCPLAALQPRIDLASFIIGEIDDRNPACAALQKVNVTLRR